MTDRLTKVSEFLESLEADTTDKATAKKIREFMTKEKLWILPTSPQQVPEKELRLQIVYNAVKCHVCGETIESHHRHDYQTCGCENEATVDGGLDYIRYGAKDMTKITKITYNHLDPHDLLRCFVSWGTYGKKGDEPLRYVPVKDMSDEHIRNILNVNHQGSAWMRNILKNELDYRTEFNISIND